MFRPLALYIGLRYTRAKRRDQFISFISLISMLGIGLGVAILITVLSVMNGFDYEIRNHLFNLANQVTISRMDGRINDWEQLIKQVEAQPHVVAAAPFVNAQGMLVRQGGTAPVMVTGILPDQEKRVSSMQSRLIQGSFDTLQPGSFNIVIGEGLAENLGLSVGDKVVMYTPQLNASPLGIYPRLKQFTVSAIFHIDENPSMDTSLAFINMRDAQLLYQLENAVIGLRLKVSDLYAAPAVANALQDSLSSEFVVTNWTQEYGTFFKAMRMEKTMIFLLLVFIIAVAAFNLVSSLVMAVNDKQADIAILRTFGATPRTILATFMVQGILLGFIGTFLGLIGGVILALNVGSVVNFIQNVFHVEFISSSVYFVNYLPSRLEWPDVWHVCAIALGLSLLATIYPAWQASRTQPAEALRYE
ncbi:MAG TPA: lipoprotein-releasing ABC transporter permease subunit [Gammaproteobacteria bacterium]|nr:lipoprotein-releasing ABC transporter permease subunit [Gammaproteobacteria bacterium]